MFALILLTSFKLAQLFLLLNDENYLEILQNILQNLFEEVSPQLRLDHWFMHE